MTLERWKPVLGYEGLYEVSDQGRVASLLGGAGRRLLRKLTPHKSGHLKVGLSKEGRKTTRYVHALVLEAFVGPAPHGAEACHFPDREPSNNHLSNLRWDTRAGNVRDAIQHGTFHSSRARTEGVCPRGHSLAAPNLVPSKASAGILECLACKRAHNHAAYRREPFSAAMADVFFADIVETTGAARPDLAA